MVRDLIAIAFAAILVVVLAYLRLPESLGAHPYWAVQVGIVGVVPGLVGAVVLRFLPLGTAAKLFIGTAALAIAFGVAKTGAARFAASYAEDAWAGKLWYFGWIATMGAVLMVFFLLVRLVIGGRG